MCPHSGQATSGASPARFACSGLRCITTLYAVGGSIRQGGERMSRIGERSSVPPIRGRILAVEAVFPSAFERSGVVWVATFGAAPLPRGGTEVVAAMEAEQAVVAVHMMSLAVVGRAREHDSNGPRANDCDRNPSAMSVHGH